MSFLLVMAVIFSGGVEVDDGVATHYHRTYGWSGVPHVAIPKWHYIPRTDADGKSIGAKRTMPMVINLCNKSSGKCLVVLGVDFCGCGGRPRVGDERVADMSDNVVKALGLDWGLGVYKTSLWTTFSSKWTQLVHSFFLGIKSGILNSWRTATSV